MHPAVRRSHHELESGDQLVLVPGRESERLGNRGAAVQAWIDVGTHVDPLLAGVGDLHDPRPAGVHDIGVQRIGNRRAPLPTGHGVPVHRRDGAEVAAAARADGARVLLRAVHPVGIRVVDGDVIDLVRRLIVPGAPRRAAVERHDRALIHPQEHALAVRGINPHLLRIVPARRTLEAGEGVAAVGGLVHSGVDGVDDVRILGVHVHAAVVAALPVGDAPVGGVHLPPRSAAVVGAVKAEVADQEHALRVRIHRDGDGRPARQARQTAARDLAPRDALVGRLEELGLRRSRLRAAPAAPAAPAAGSGNPVRACHRNRVMAHRGREHDLGVVRGPRDLLGSRRVVDVEGLGPRLAAVGRAEDAAGFAFLVDVSLGRDDHEVGIVRIDQDRGDLFGVV